MNGYWLESVLLNQRRWTAASLWAGLVAAATYLFYFEPGRSGFFPPCPFHTLTGLNCPGCGTTRALHQLLHGNVVAAFELNPLLLALLPLLAGALILYTRSVISGTSMPQLYLPNKYAWVLSALVLGFWIIRNTAVYPFQT